jgi:hypothetical protein
MRAPLVQSAECLSERKILRADVVKDSEAHTVYLELHTAVWGTVLVAQLVEALRYKPEGCGFDF